MVIKLYKTTSDKTTVNKELTDEIVLTGNLKQNTSIVKPIIEVRSDTIITSNYVYIPEFERYYYVIDTIVTSAKTYELQLKCDVLMSFRSQFLPIECVIARQENEYNLYLVDDTFKTYNYRHVVNKKLPMSLPTTNNLILVLAGNRTTAPTTTEV